ncbi:Pyruvate kinase [Candidatus Hepatincolaceae symbiont of Richtersius coronifer]
MQVNKESKRVKIVSTIGPVSRSFEMLEKLFLAGVNVFRLNFSHSNYEEHTESYNNIRAVSKKYGVPLSILADMQGPKLRVGKFKNKKEFLELEQKFILDLNEELGDTTRVCLPHPEIFEALKEGDSLLIDDGKIRLQVEQCGANYAETIVKAAGYISDKKGVNFPSGILKLSPLTEKDLKDLDFALNLGVDYIGLSFVQLSPDVEQARELIKGRAKIISKIEKPSAVENITSIIEASDGIMVARGDLGVEIPTEEVPVVQKMIIRECRRQSKPVIVATQMLDSMTNAPIPTRAEASDVANAVYDGTDAVMLSGETTVGEFPVETVNVMANIISSVENDPLYWDVLKTSYDHIIKSYLEKNPKEKHVSIGRAISIAAKEIADAVDAKVIVAFSFQGTTAHRISHQRPRAKILCITDNPVLYNQLNLGWGITPLLVETVSSFSEIADLASSWLKTNNWVKIGEKFLVVAGVPVGLGGITNSIRVLEME